MKIFFTASDEEIKQGKVTDVYFTRSQKVLESNNIDKHVKMEARVKRIPNYEWGVFAGLEEVLNLLQGTDISLWSLPEGSLFKDHEPVLMLEGKYRDFAPLETPLLGFICQSSGISTKAAYIKLAAKGKPVYHFGARRMHPSIAPMIGRSAYIGGCDGVAVTKTAELLGIEPVGTIPHALILLLEDSTSATGMFEQIFGTEISTVALVDTFGDEKFEALENADLTEGLDAVRLDTPSSRRGSMLDIAREVRWELDLNGFEDVKIFISGGLDEQEISKLNEVSDAYGVGTSISNSSVLDFSLDIVEINNEPIAKRGKRSGAKQLYECEECGARTVMPWANQMTRCKECEGAVKQKLNKVLDRGKVVVERPQAKDIRKYTLDQLSNYIDSSSSGR